MRGSIKGSKSLKEYVEERLLEVGYLQCEECGRSNNIDPPHHIVFKSEKPNHPEIHNKRNLILLCRKCHDFFHGKCKNPLPKKEARRHLIEERDLVELFGKDIL